MPTLDKILERRKEVSSQVSSQTRALSLGLLALSWAFLTPHDDPLRRVMLSPAYRISVFAMAALAVLALASDLVQYVLYTKVADEALGRAEALPSKAATYDDTRWYYKLAGRLYHVKFYLLIASSFIFVVIVTALVFL